MCKHTLLQYNPLYNKTLLPPFKAQILYGNKTVDGWQIKIRKTPVRGIAANMHYRRDTLSGKLD